MKYSYKIIDAHCDTIAEMYRYGELKKNNMHLDIERMMLYKNYLQLFAVWTDSSLGAIKQKKRCFEIIKRFHKQLEINNESIMHIKNADDIKKSWSSGKIGAILGVEGADFVKELCDIDELYENGVRAVTLTWNASNKIASGVGDESADFGLTAFGEKVVKRLNELGMIIDVSHISKRAFWDVISLTKVPISATHSNSASICNHIRNLSDEQFLALIKNGGVAGINYYPQFINKTNDATVDDIIKHIEHFCSLGGENNIGLGGDFDGIEVTPCDLRGVEEVHRLLDRLLSLNYSEDVVEKIAYRNFYNLLEKVLK